MADRRIAIGLMCKPPRAGVSKTRLAASVGAEHAAALSAAFLKDTASSVAEFLDMADVYALYTPEDAAPELKPMLPTAFHLQPLSHDDVGEAMHSAITSLLAAERLGVILIGADLPTLPSAILREAIGALSTPEIDAVIGPSEDGGYYLIGLKAPCAEIFSAMPWSTPTVYAMTAERLRSAGLAFHELPRWYDVDDGASLSRLRQHLKLGGYDAHIGGALHTREALEGIDP